MAEGTQVLDTVFGNTTVIKLVAFDKKHLCKGMGNVFYLFIYLFAIYLLYVCLSMFIYLI